MKPNIVCNDCLAGFTYSCLNMAAQNPLYFTWIQEPDYRFIIEHYNEINWRNIEVLPLYLEDIQKMSKSDAAPFMRWNPKNERQYYYIRLDGKVNIYFFHHTEHKIHPQDSVRGVTRTLIDAKTYIHDTWLKRVERMEGDPIFVLDLNTSNLHLKNFVDLKASGRYNLVIISRPNKKYDEYIDIKSTTAAIRKNAQLAADFISSNYK